MVYRVLSFCLAALGLALLAGVPTQAGEKGKRGETHDGVVVRATAKELVMNGKAKEGEKAKEHKHTLAPGAKVTCDGKECKLEDLKPGLLVRVTTKAGDKTVATRVEALEKNKRFEKRGAGEGKETRGAK